MSRRADWNLCSSLGCRSGSYILYAAVSTLVWLLLLISSLLSYYVTTTPRILPDFLPSVARWSSIVLRWVAKVLAACNAVWIVASCVFQFSNFYDRCWCNSSVLMWGEDLADFVLQLENADIQGIRAVWIGGVALAAGISTGFVIFVNLYINPPPSQLSPAKKQ